MTTETKPFEFRGAITDVETPICDNAVTVLARHIPSGLDFEITSFMCGDEDPLTREQAVEFAQLLVIAINNKNYLENEPG